MTASCFISFIYSVQIKEEEGGRATGSNRPLGILEKCWNAGGWQLTDVPSVGLPSLAQAARRFWLARSGLCCVSACGILLGMEVGGGIPPHIPDLGHRELKHTDRT